MAVVFVSYKWKKKNEKKFVRKKKKERVNIIFFFLDAYNCASQMSVKLSFFRWIFFMYRRKSIDKICSCLCDWIQQLDYNDNFPYIELHVSFRWVYRHMKERTMRIVCPTLVLTSECPFYSRTTQTRSMPGVYCYKSLAIFSESQPLKKKNISTKRTALF